MYVYAFARNVSTLTYNYRLLVQIYQYVKHFSDAHIHLDTITLDSQYLFVDIFFFLKYITFF